MASEPDQNPQESPEDIEARIVEAVESYLFRLTRGETVDLDAYCVGFAEEEREGIRRRCLDALEVQRSLEGWGKGAGETLPDLGELVVRRELGRGACGVVYLAYQSSLDRDVAVKVIEASQTRSAVRFRRETTAEAKLKHPGIVQVYYTGETARHMFVVMDYVKGGTLEGVIDRQRTRRAGVSTVRAAENGSGRDEPARAALLVAQIAEALHHAHGQGIIHRDVKPSNILIDEESAPHLADFGLAKDISAETISKSGELLGTPFYMSPEQIRLKRLEVDGRTDVYSLGVVLYEMLTCERPFHGDTLDSLFQEIRTKSPQSVRKLNNRVPRDLEVICLKAFEKAPADRYQSAQEFARDLRSFLDGAPIRARPPGLARRAQRLLRRQAIALSAIAGVLTLLALTWMLFSTRADRLREQKSGHVWRAQLSMETGDLDAAETHLEAAGLMEGDHPLGPMLLAVAHAGVGRFKEADVFLALAVKAGLPRTAGELETPMEHLCFGLLKTVTSGAVDYVQAEHHLSRAVQMDPDLAEAYFPLYQVRLALSDLEGARLALRAYQRTITLGDPTFDLVEALLFELGGEFGSACEVLEQVLNDASDATVGRELRVHRYLGRNYLQVGNLDRAEAALEQAVADFPKDASSWANLATLSLRRYALDQAAETLLQVAEQRAQRALDINPTSSVPPRVLAWVALYRLETRAGAGGPIQAAEAELEAALGRLQGSEAGEATLNLLEAHRAYVEGGLALNRGDSQSAADSFLACLEADDSHIPARALLAELYWFQGEQERGWEHIDRALTVCDSKTASGHGVPEKWLQVALIWTFGLGAQLGKTERAVEARDRMLTRLDGPGPFDKIEMVNFAQFLAEPTDCQDCESAHRVVDEQSLGTAFVDTPPEEDVREILRQIDEYCP